MEEPTWYLPEGDFTEKRTVVTGFPGFTHKSERTHIDHLLQKITFSGIIGVRVNYPGISLREDGGKINQTRSLLKDDLYLQQNSLSP